MQPPPMNSGKRFYYLDVVKVLCLSFVFLFHCFRIFDADSWHIKNTTRLTVEAAFVYDLGMAVMPGFFVISGASIWFSMKKRTGVVFLQNIFKRFFFPLLFGLTVLAIPQVYFERMNQGQFSGSIISFIPHYFEGLHGMGGNFAWSGLHLWFMIMLFVYSIILLPFFMLGKQWLPHPFFQKVLKNHLVLLLFAAIIVVPGWKLHPNGWMGNMWGGWNIFQDFIFLALGFVLFSSPNFIENCKRYKWISLVIALVLTALTLYWYAPIEEVGFRSAFYTLKLSVKAVACWAWISAVLGITAQYFNGETRFIKYWTIAALPFYILSQPVIIAVGYYVVQWPLTLWTKFCIVTGASFIITILLYEGIKRNKMLRWMFGIPAKSSAREFYQKLPNKRKLKVFYQQKIKRVSAGLPAD